MVPRGWSDDRINDLLEGLESGVSVNGENRQLCPDEKGVLKVSAVSYGTFDPKAVKAIEIESELKRAKTHPKKDQVIISRSNTEYLVGASAYVDRDYKELYLPDKLWQTIPKLNTSMKWLSYFLSSEHARYTLSNLATGTSGSMKNITKGEFLSLKVATPPYIEQCKIANILGTWDKAISTTERLIDNSKEQKKSLMQQLLTGKKRLLDDSGKPFEAEWDSVAIGDVVELFNGFAFKSSDALETGRKWLKIANIGIGEIKWKDSSYLPEDYKNEYEKFSLKVGDIVVAMTRPTLGNQLKIARLKRKSDEALLNQRVAKVLFSDKVNSEYMYQLLSTIEVALKLNSALLGTDPPNLSAKVLHEIQMEMPPLVEQQRIAAVLTNTDKEIERLVQQLADLKQEKKALMQQLLTGKRRVKIAKDAA
jgi:type I restriction enzyme S subunit